MAIQRIVPFYTKAKLTGLPYYAPRRFVRHGRASPAMTGGAGLILRLLLSLVQVKAITVWFFFITLHLHPFFSKIISELTGMSVRGCSGLRHSVQK